MKVGLNINVNFTVRSILIKLKSVKVKHFILCLIFCFIFHEHYAQSPWVKSKGEGFSQISFTTIPEYKLIFRDGTSARYTERTAVDNTIQSYSEVGIGEELSLLLIAPYKLLELGDRTVFDAADPQAFAFSDSTVSGELDGLSNIRLGIRKGFQLKSLQSSIQISVDLPTHIYDEETGISTGYKATSFSTLFSIGKGISETKYISLYTGATYRSNGFSSLLIIGGEFGVKTLGRLWLIPFLDFNFSLKNGRVTLPARQINNAFYINDQEFTAFGLKSIVEINENIGLTLGFGGAFTANNVAQAPALSIGGYYKW